MSSLRTFSNVEYLAIVDNAKGVALSALCPLNRLTSLSMVDCKVTIDTTDLQSCMPRLENLELGGLKQSQAVQLSTANPNVAVSNGVATFRGGTRVD